MAMVSPLKNPRRHRRARGREPVSKREGSGMMSSSADALQRIRALCLALPETSERSSWGHPNFRAGKKTFAAFERVRGRPSIAFRLDPEDIQRLSRRKHFFATPYGRGQWISTWTDVSLDWNLIERLLRRGYRLVALKRMIVALEGASRKVR
jgi:predicted DNA-binding protein (MmcQ/YjbR family)